MIKTPETDLFDSKWDSYSNPWEAIQLARKLELERDEAREAIRALAEHGESEIQRITKERDEARDEASMWKWHWMGARKEVENLIKEGAE